MEEVISQKKVQLKTSQKPPRLNKDYVTRAELNLTIERIDRKMENGFNEVTAAITELRHSIDNTNHALIEKFDNRYLSKEDEIPDTVRRLNSPEVKRACFNVAQEYLNTEDGKEKIGSMITHHIECSRDNLNKWINFVKVLGGIIIGALMIYGGTSVYKTHLQNTAQIKTLTEQPQNKGD